MTTNNLLILSIRDFFTFKMIKFSLIPLVITAITMYFMFFSIAQIGLEKLGGVNIQTTQTSMQNGIPHTQTTNTKIEEISLLSVITNSSVFTWFSSAFIHIVSSLFTVYVSIFITLLIIGFLTPFILKELQKKYYQDIKMIGYSNIIQSLLMLLKWIFIMLMLFIILIPFYFIPFINIIAFNFPLYYLFHNAITYDIASTICTKNESRSIKSSNKYSLRAKTIFLYIISLIPFAILFIAVFFVIYLGHTYFTEIKKIRYSTNQ